MDQNIENAFCVFPFNRMQSIDGKRETVRAPLLDQENDCRDQDRDNAGRAGEPVVSARLGKEGIVYFHREGSVSLPDQQRSTEVCESTHEYEQSRSQDRRHA